MTLLLTDESTISFAVARSNGGSVTPGAMIHISSILFSKSLSIVFKPREAAPLGGINTALMSAVASGVARGSDGPFHGLFASLGA